jgi:riboflavin synthase
MFTGIIEQTGTLVSLKDTGGVRRLTVEAPGIAERLREGDSLAVSGVCLTALEPEAKYFHADLAQETLDRTSLGSLAPGAKVNLEMPTAAGSPLGGHVVQGHVDGAGELRSFEPLVSRSRPDFNEKTTDWTLKVRVPENTRQWMVPKGSVAIEGISLTIAGIEGDEISIAILPLTYWRTGECGSGCSGEAGVRRDAGCEEETGDGADRGLAGGEWVLSDSGQCAVDSEQRNSLIVGVIVSGENR